MNTCAPRQKNRSKRKHREREINVSKQDPNHKRSEHERQTERTDKCEEKKKINTKIYTVMDVLGILHCIV